MPVASSMLASPGSPAMELRSGPLSEKPGEVDLARKVQFLSDSAHLGDPGAPVERIETHFAWVFLTPRDVYKLRKPIRYHGLDTLSMSARRASSEQDLLLNADLAPGVYREVVPLTVSRTGELAVRGEGDIVDWVTRMRRLPATRMLDTAGPRGVNNEDLERLFRHLTGFYERSRSFLLSGEDYCGRIAARIAENCTAVSAAADVADLAVSRVDALAAGQRALMERLRHVLTRRAAGGCIRDCHGDLRPEHIWLGPPVLVIDRLELDPGLRQLDPLEELCFLKLESERLGFPEVGRWLVEKYVATNAVEPAPALTAFYLGTRAFGRARLAAWRLLESEADRVRWSARVRDYVTRGTEAVTRGLSN